MTVLPTPLAAFIATPSIRRLLDAVRKPSFYAWDESDARRLRCADCGQRWEPVPRDDDAGSAVTTWSARTPLVRADCRCHRATMPR